MMKWVRSMTKTKTRSEQQKKPRLRFVFTWHDFGIFLSMLSFATILCYFLRTIDDSDVYVALIFELTVVLVSRFTDGYLFGLLSSVVGVIGINYIFTFPYYQLNFTISGYPLTFLVMLIVSVVVSTLTTQIKQQEKIRAEAEKEKMRGNLLRAVSHDIRTPLTSIVGGVSTLLDSGDQLDEATRTQLLENIRDESNWLVSVVENLLSVTRFDGEQVAVKKTPTVLEELLDTVLVKFKKRCPDVPVQLELPEDFVMIPMDSMLIQQVLMNLLENAALYAEGMTKLTLKVFTVGNRAVFEVTDNGCGIPRERLKTLFSGTDPDVPADSRKHGMGIGLSVCAAIVKAHGGEIQAESKVGEGTSIRFWLETESIETEENEDEQ